MSGTMDPRQQFLFSTLPGLLGQAYDYVRRNPLQATADVAQAVTPGGALQDALAGSGQISQAAMRGDIGGMVGGAGAMGAGLLGAIPLVGMAGRGAGVFSKTINPQEMTTLRETLSTRYPNVALDISQSPSEHLVVSRIVVPKEERGQGIGTAIMRDLIQEAENRNIPMALTPDSSFGGNLKRLKEFYGNLGFTPNTGRNKDYRISESMIREPQASNPGLLDME